MLTSLRLPKRRPTQLCQLSFGQLRPESEFLPPSSCPALLLLLPLVVLFLPFLFLFGLPRARARLLSMLRRRPRLRSRLRLVLVLLWRAEAALSPRALPQSLHWRLRCGYLLLRGLLSLLVLSLSHLPRSLLPPLKIPSSSSFVSSRMLRLLAYARQS